MKIIFQNKALRSIAIVNFLFVASYAAFGVHSLFFFVHSAQSETLRGAVITGMALFAATQVGGVSLLSLFGSKISNSLVLLVLFRISAPILLATPNRFTIIAGMLFFGLSHAIYSVRSRVLVSQLLQNNDHLQVTAYSALSITTNLAFLLAPPIGGYLLKTNLGLIPGVLLSIVCTAASLIVFFALNAQNKVNTPQKIETNKTPESISKFNKKNYLLDLIRFSAFILPYAIFMALIPIRGSNERLSAFQNGLLFGLNGLLIIVFQSAF